MLECDCLFTFAKPYLSFIHVGHTDGYSSIEAFNCEGWKLKFKAYTEALQKYPAGVWGF